MSDAEKGRDPLSVLRDAGLYDPAGEGAAVIRELVEWLSAEGVPFEAIVRAAEACELSALAGDRALRPGDQFSLRETSEQLEVDVDILAMLRQASGFAPVDLDQPVLTKPEIESFRRLQDASRMFTEAEANHFARVLGSSLARIADAAVSMFLVDVETPMRAEGATEADVARRNLDAISALDAVGDAMDPFLRMHMDAAIRRNRAARLDDTSPETVRMAVCFVDLVGFTAVGSDVSTRQLGQLVREFEDRAYDTVSGNDGRVVKLIGDEVMFVAVEAANACRAAASLIGSFADHDHVTPRGGLAYGELLARGGDFYGPVVNMASRVCDLAVPMELLATPDIAEQAPRFAFEPAGRRQLKGFVDPVTLVSLSLGAEL